VGKDPADAFGKRFKTYRMGLGVTDKREGHRQDRVAFHQFRSWFNTTARNAGFDKATLAAIIGHENGNIGDDLYSGGPSVEMKRRCIEAVRLPAATPQATAPCAEAAWRHLRPRRRPMIQVRGQHHGDRDGIMVDLKLDYAKIALQRMGQK
jgi:hypothetical protein